MARDRLSPLSFAAGTAERLAAAGVLVALLWLGAAWAIA
jgi:hypothetical protein